MRKINKIIVHCSAGSINNSADDIVRFHTSPVSKGGRGWKVPGYHFFVEKDGKVVPLVPVEMVSNGVAGHNHDSINVCYAGGVDQRDFKTPKDTRTPEQKAALRSLLRNLKARFHCPIYGHRDFAAKACPSFDAKSEYKDL